MQHKYLTNILSYIVPFGSNDDPDGKEGLLTAACKSYEFGTKKYPTSSKLFSELEKTGAVFSVDGERDFGGISVRFLPEKVKKAEEMLGEIIKNVRTTPKDFQKIKASMVMNLDELESNPMNFTQLKFENLVLGERSPLGTKSSIKKITLDDIEKLQKKIAKESEKVKLTKQMERISPIFKKSSKRSAEQVKQAQRFHHISKELPQKVIFWGYRIKGLMDYDIVVRNVATQILSSGLVGLVPEIIREKHSAAYYAYSNTITFRDKGVFFIAAGVSEESTAKCTQLIRDIVDRVLDGDFEDKRVQIAKKKTSSIFDLVAENPTSLMGFYSKYLAYGYPSPDIEDLQKKTDQIDKKDVVNYFRLAVGEAEPYLVINGNLNKSTIEKCQKIVSR